MVREGSIRTARRERGRGPALRFDRDRPFRDARGRPNAAASRRFVMDMPVTSMRSRSDKSGQRAKTRSSSAVRIVSAFSVSELTIGSVRRARYQRPIAMRIFDDLLTSGIASRRNFQLAVPTTARSSTSASVTFGISAISARRPRRTAMSTMNSGRCGREDMPNRRFGGQHEVRRAGRRNHRCSAAHSDAVISASRRRPQSRSRRRVRTRARSCDWRRSKREAPRRADALGGYASILPAPTTSTVTPSSRRGAPREVDGGGCDASGFRRRSPVRARAVFPALSAFAEQAVQRLAERSGALRAAYAFLDLAEYFGYADSASNPAGRDAEEMFDRLRAQMRVKIRFEIVHDGGRGGSCEELLGCATPAFESSRSA